MLNITTETGKNAEENGKGGKPKRSLIKDLLEKMQIWINGSPEAERDEFLGWGRHEALAEKHDNYRKGEFESAWLPERKGQDPELESFLAEVFLAGCSTRDLARITEKHLGQKYDSKQISRIVGRASQDLEAWRLRRLEGRKYKFLYIDGANFAVRINGRVGRQSVCAVLGVSEEGECFEVLALEMGDREWADLW